MEKIGSGEIGVAQPGRISRILVPVDYSACSHFACRYAMKLACRFGAEVRFLHTYYSPAFDLIELAGAVQTQAHLREEVEGSLEENEREAMKSLMAEMEVYAGECGSRQVALSYELTPGVPEDEIVRYSEQYQPDLIVMGTRGKSSGIAAVIGSVTAAVINRVQFTLLAIPERYTFVGEKNIKRVMYVTEFDESDFVSLKKLMLFTGQLQLEIHCVHIGTDPDRWDMIRMEGLMDYFRKAYNTSAVTYGFLNQSRLTEELDKLIRESEINIISVTAHRQSILERLFRPNLTKKIFYHSAVPLLVFH